MGMLLSILLMTCSFPLSFPSAPQRPRNLLPCVSRWEEMSYGDPFEFQYFRNVCDRSIDVSPLSRIIAPVAFCCFPQTYVRTYFETLFVHYWPIPGWGTSSAREKFASANVKIRAAGYLTCPKMFDSSNVRHTTRSFNLFVKFIR